MSYCRDSEIAKQLAQVNADYSNTAWCYFADTSGVWQVEPYRMQNEKSWSRAGYTIVNPRTKGPRIIARTCVVKSRAVEGEYIVFAFDQLGERMTESDYHTTDEDDAMQNAVAMVQSDRTETAGVTYCVNLDCLQPTDPFYAAVRVAETFGSGLCRACAERIAKRHKATVVVDPD